MWFGRQHDAYKGGIPYVRVASEVDVSPRQSPHQQYEVSALFQTSEPRQAALWHMIQHPRQRIDISTMRECVQQLTESDYPDSPPFRDALIHFFVAYSVSTLWTQCNKPYELPACRIEKTSLKLLQLSTECIMHCWDDWTTDCDQRSLWSRQISWHSKRFDSVAPLLALHTTRPSH